MNRRDFINRAARLSAAGVFALSSHPALVPRVLAAKPNRIKLAAVLTEFTFRSHAHVLLENFLDPYLYNGRVIVPDMDVLGFYVDQFADRDMAREVAAKYGVTIYPAIAQALCLGGNSLAVDGVLSIGEHGKYPFNEKGQHEYPRKRFFDEIVAVFRSSGHVVPVFNDKHLSYRWDWAKEMYDTSRKMKVPFMAGSSVPLAERRPPLEIPRGSRIIEAVSIHSGPVESYDFHGLEVLQSMVENRRGAEKGVAQVQFLNGEALWKAASDGLWSPELAQAALATDSPVPATSPAELIAPKKSGDGKMPIVDHGILLRYRDGLRAIVLGVSQGGGIKWQFACRIKDRAEPLATSFYVGPWQNRNLFKALAHAIQVGFRERRAPYPVERTLLTTGILAAAMDSRFENGRALETPWLDVPYQARDFSSVREMGGTWKILTEDVAEPKTLDPLGTARGRVVTPPPAKASTANERQ